MPFVLVSNLLSANWPHHWLNLGLLAALGLACILWLVLAVRGRVSPASGAGFAVAGYALAVRIACEFYLSFFGDPVRLAFPGHLIVDMSVLARYGGLIGYVFGLAVVLAACLWERRMARDAPEWTRPW